MRHTHPGGCGSMKKLILAVTTLLAVGMAPPLAAVQWGADLSSAPRLATAGAQWLQDGQPADPLDLLAASGWRLLRLRLWHMPADPWQGLDSTLAFAARARAAGFDLLLDLHFSDSWADPGQQTPPAAWQGLPLAVLADSVRGYTRRVLERFAAAGAAPRWVQLGNEIDGGLLWPAGRVDGGWDTPTQWSALRQLLAAASGGVAEAFPDTAARPGRIVHLANSGWWIGCRRFLDSLTTADGPAFEAIGLSYYPWWHGAPSLLQETLDGAATRYGKPLWIVETAYPFTLGWDDDTGNLVGLEGQLLPGFPASPAGQQAFLEMLRARLAAVPGGLGRGLICWEPAWISAPQAGSPWENLCLFDFDGEALPALALPGRLDPLPPLVTAERTSAHTLRLSWPAVPAATAYRVEQAAEPGGPWTLAGETAALEWESPPVAGRAFFRVRSVGATPR
jgi:arabinogalactan endo-1,4-beta-galactosidase